MPDLDDVNPPTDSLPVIAAIDDAAAQNGHGDVQAEELNYDEQFYPARPSRLRPRARLRVCSLRIAT